MIAYRNLMPAELENLAYNEGNELAIALSEAMFDYGYESAEENLCPSDEDVSMAEVAEVVKFLYTEAEWFKIENGHYVLSEFDESFNCYNNDIRIKKDGARWEVKIMGGDMGEESFERTVSGNFKTAMNAAIDLAVEVAGEGKLRH